MKSGNKINSSDKVCKRNNKEERKGEEPSHSIDELEALRIQNAAYEAENEELRQLLGDDYIQLADQDDGWQPISEDEFQEEGVFEIEGALANSTKKESVFASHLTGNIEHESKRSQILKALDANSRLQEQVRRTVALVQAARSANELVYSRINTCVDHKRRKAATLHSSLSTRRNIEYTGKSWYWSTAGEKRQVLKYKGTESVEFVSKYLPLVNRSGAWSQEEREKLKIGVVEIAKERMVADIVASNAGITMEEFTELQRPIRELSFESEQVISLVERFTPQEWSTIAGRHVTSRNGLDCKLQWKNFLHPHLLHDRFSQDEREQLVSLVEKVGDRSWEYVAENLKGRTPLQCLSEYMQIRSQMQEDKEPSISGEDLTRLNDLVAKYGQSWKRLEEEFDGKFSAHNLMYTWRKHHQSTQGGKVAAKKGPWDPLEDECLLKAVALYGKEWSKVAFNVPGRNELQCRERFVNSLDPELARQREFSDEETSVMLEQITKSQIEGTRISWSKIAKLLPGRTDKMCRKAYEKIQRQERKKAKRKK